ncbi:MAG TPA: hypothetical protein VHY91_21205 [Pirellulales bacterium]|jgi:hypothetical protein|nr:hypothetical protein [Pirellulales bacterium]
MTRQRIDDEPGSRAWLALRCLVLAIAGLAPLSSMPTAGAAERPAGSQASAPRDATFDDVKLDLKKDEPFKRTLLTPKVKELDGKWIKIRGYILPSFQDTGIKQFVLMRDNMECCFGKGAALHDCILVELLDDATTNFTVRPVTVIGKFSIKEVVDAEGKQLAIYRLDAREAK